MNISKRTKKHFSGMLKLVAKALAILGTTVEKKMNERHCN